MNIFCLNRSAPVNITLNTLLLSKHLEHLRDASDLFDLTSMPCVVGILRPVFISAFAGRLRTRIYSIHLLLLIRSMVTCIKVKGPYMYIQLTAFRLHRHEQHFLFFFVSYRVLFLWPFEKCD